MPLYFAYGSNLDLEQMKERCPDSKLLEVGCLEGYRLEFTSYSHKRGGGVADIILDSENEVWGLIYELSQDDLDQLDVFEGYGMNIYKRFLTSIKTSLGSISDVWVYTVVDKENFIPPAKEYLNIIRKAASIHKFPKRYRSYLDSIQTL